jgi:uncharacterized protein YjbJ (UPF0337 family)
MSILDKITGRVKKTIGEVTGHEETRKQGAREEHKGEVAEQAEQAERRAAEKRLEEAELERRT